MQYYSPISRAGDQEVVQPRVDSISIVEQLKQTAVSGTIICRPDTEIKGTVLPFFKLLDTEAEAMKKSWHGSRREIYPMQRAMKCEDYG